MKRFLFISLWISGLGYLCADSIVIAAHPSFAIESLDKEEIKKIYLAKKFRISNQKILPVNLGLDHPLREKFEKKILNEDRDALMHIWLQAHYLGHRPPKVFKSQESVAEFIANVENAIGYMEESTAQKYHLKLLFKESE